MITAMMRRLRFAPLLLAMLLLAVLMRIGAVWDSLSALTQGSGLVAAAAASEPKAKAQKQKADDHAGEHGSRIDTSGTEKPARPQAACEPVPPPGPSFSEPEIAVLQQLAQRREGLDQREQELERRQMLLAAAESRIADKLAAMERLQAVLESMIKRNDAEMEARVRSLVKIYELMKPADAARIFEALDMETLLPVAERMNERRLAPVMAQMNPAKAKDVTERLKQLRDLAGQSVP